MAPVCILKYNVHMADKVALFALSDKREHFDLNIVFPAMLFASSTLSSGEGSFFGRSCITESRLPNNCFFISSSVMELGIPLMAILSEFSHGRFFSSGLSAVVCRCGLSSSVFCISCRDTDACIGGYMPLQGDRVSFLLQNNWRNLFLCLIDVTFSISPSCKRDD